MTALIAIEYIFNPKHFIWLTATHAKPHPEKPRKGSLFRQAMEHKIYWT